MHNGSWKMSALTLLRASDKIYEDYIAANQRERERDITETQESQELHGQELEDLWDMQLYPVYLLLVGYAVENLIKGIIFSRDPNLLVSGEKLSNNHTNHSLVDLFKKTGLSMDDDIEEILIGLRQFIVWKGRYSIPKNINIYMNEREFPKILYDRKKIEDFIIYLISQLNKIPSVAFEKADTYMGV